MSGGWGSQQMDNFFQGVTLVLEPDVLIVIFLASLYGLAIGALPGLTATMAIALLVPVTFFLDPVSAIAAITATTATAIFAGDIPGALLRIPGTPASAAYTEDAYALTLLGRPEAALGASLIASVAGGVVGVVLLMLFAPALARFAVQFSSVEYFWLAVLGLSCAVAVSGDSLLRGTLSLLIGLLISTVGIDIATGYPRFTFGSIHLLSGISFIPAMIGIFAVSQVIRVAVAGRQTNAQTPIRALPDLVGGMWRALVRFRMTILRSSLIGNLLGALPGAGADIAAWVSYSVSRLLSRTPETYGKGSEEGIAAGGAANNSAVAGAWTPALVLGIPGDSITAIAVGVMMMKGITPGPRVFVTDGPEVYAIFLGFLLANLLLLPLGFVAIKLARHVLSVPQAVLMPVILMFSITGAFAVDNAMFAVGIIAVLGLVAFGMEENRIPFAPAILGIVLGAVIEKNFLITMIKTQGSLAGFFDRPLAAVLGGLTIAVWALILARALLRRASVSESLAND